MAVAVSGGKPCCVAGAQCFLTLVGHEHHLAGEDIDEFVFVAVPMTLARPGTRRQATQVDAELGQPGGIAELGALTGATGAYRTAVGRVCRPWREVWLYRSVCSPIQLLSKG